MTRTGACECGAITYELNDDSKAGVICYCSTCRTISSDHSFNLPTSTDAVKVTRGTPKEYLDKNTNSGKPMQRFFCGDCGTALWSDPSAAPGKRYLKVGTLADANDVQLVAEVYVESAIGTHHPIDKSKCGQKHFEGVAKEV